MKRLLGVLVLILSMPALSAADIVLTVPSVTLSNSNASGSFTVTAALTGSYDVAGYNLKLTLTPRAGTTGLSFNGASGAAPNYLFTVSHDGFSVLPANNQATWIYGADTVSWPTPAQETIANVTRNMVTVNLAIAPGTLGVWDVAFVAPPWSGLNDPGGDKLTGQTFNGGVITVTPEPLTVSLLAIGGLGLAWPAAGAG